MRLNLSVDLLMRKTLKVQQPRNLPPLNFTSLDYRKSELNSHLNPSYERETNLRVERCSSHKSASSAECESRADCQSIDYEQTDDFTPADAATKFL